MVSQVLGSKDLLAYNDKYEMGFNTTAITHEMPRQSWESLVTKKSKPFATADALHLLDHMLVYVTPFVTLASLRGLSFHLVCVVRAGMTTRSASPRKMRSTTRTSDPCAAPRATTPALPLPEARRLPPLLPQPARPRRMTQRTGALRRWGTTKCCLPAPTGSQPPPPRPCPRMWCVYLCLPVQLKACAARLK
jgi:hypothetical protein